MNEIAQLKQQIQVQNSKIKSLEIFVESLKSSKAIPLSVDQAFRRRFSSSELSSSSKAGSSEWVNIDEAGTGNYNAAGPMDGFVVSKSESGVTLYLPYYL